MSTTVTSAIIEEGRDADGSPRPIAIIAAATAWKKGERPKLNPLQETDLAWQREIWALVDQIPELAFYISWHHNAASRVRLKPVKMVDGSPVALSGGGIGTEPGVSAEDVEEEDTSKVDELVIEMVNALGGGPAGAALALSRAVLHIAGIGESYSVFGDEGAVEVLSPYTELRWSELNGWEYEESVAVWKPVLGHIVRGWEPAPDRRLAAWSPLKAALPVLRELAALTQLVGAEADSRLSAGLLLIPQEWSPPQGLKAFTDDLIEQLSSPISDRASASSVVPLPLPMPQELIEKVRHIRFGMDLSEQTKELRDESVRRFAMGARIPPEILTGTGDISHWGQWFIDEQGIKLFIAPEVHIVLHSWTVGWLIPLLVHNGVPEEVAKNYAVWPDFTPLVLRPDRSSDAVALYDRLLLSGEAVLRETGFDVNDAPSPEEKIEQLIVTVARQAPNSIAELLPFMPGIPPGLIERLQGLQNPGGRPAGSGDDPVEEGGGVGGEPGGGMDEAGVAGQDGPGRGV